MVRHPASVSVVHHHRLPPPPFHPPSSPLHPQASTASGHAPPCSPTRAAGPSSRYSGRALPPVHWWSSAAACAWPWRVCPRPRASGRRTPFRPRRRSRRRRSRRLCRLCFQRRHRRRSDGGFGDRDRSIPWWSWCPPVVGARRRNGRRCYCDGFLPPPCLQATPPGIPPSVSVGCATTSGGRLPASGHWRGVHTGGWRGGDQMVSSPPRRGKRTRQPSRPRWVRPGGVRGRGGTAGPVVVRSRRRRWRWWRRLWGRRVGPTSHTRNGGSRGGGRRGNCGAVGDS